MKSIMQMSAKPGLSANSPDALGVHPEITPPAKALGKTPMSVASVPLIEPSMTLVTATLAQLFPGGYYASRIALVY